MLDRYKVGFGTDTAREELLRLLAGSSLRRRDQLCDTLMVIEKKLTENPQSAGFPYPKNPVLRVVSHAGVIVTYKVEKQNKRVFIVQICASH